MDRVHVVQLGCTQDQVRTNGKTSIQLVNSATNGGSIESTKSDQSSKHVEESLLLKLTDPSAPFPVSKVPISNVTRNGVSNSVSSASLSTSTSTSSSESVNTKAFFYDTMAKLIRCQLENCDPATPVSELWSPAPSPGSLADSSSSVFPMSCGSFPRLKDSSSKPYMLQPSLFPLQHPTVYFAANDGELAIVPNEIKSFLRWKLTTITANTMRNIVQRSGYRLVAIDKNNKQKSFSNWNAIWCKHLKVSEFNLVGYHQRVNHFPGSFNFGRKDRLWLNLKAKADKYGYDVFGSFHPRTFILPCEYSQLLEYWKEDGKGESSKANGELGSQFGSHKKVFICKPPASARGQGINIVSTVEELNQLLSTANTLSPSDSDNKPLVNRRPPKVSLVVQEYISNPCLLHNSAKFDLRVYVLVTSISPLRLYVYEEGIVRFASNRYSKNLEDIKNQFIHLTNYSVNKNSQEYVPSSSTDSQEGHKWTLKTLWKYLAATGVAKPEQIWADVIDLIVKTVISAESQILSLLKQHLKNKRSCFELLGFDIMIDEAFKLWLLEVNITPSLRADSVLDFSVKNQLVRDILNTIGYQLSPRFRKFYNFGAHLSPDKADWLNQMKTANEEKHCKYETLFLDGGLPACKDMIDELNEDDLYQLMEAEDELARAGQFRRIFPSPGAREYLPYFDFPYYYNMLLINWEEQYHGNRAEGIARIRAQLMEMPQVQEAYKKLKTQVEDNEKSLVYLRK